MIQKGVNIWSFPSGKSIEQCMREAKAAGFDGIELAFNVKGPLSAESTPEEILSYKKLAEDIGITIGGLAFARYGSYCLASNHECVRQMTKDLIRKHLDTAALLGVSCILVVPGRAERDLGPDPENPKPGEFIDYVDSYHRAVDGLKELAPYAEQKGVAIGVENVWNGFLLSPLEMRRFIDDIGSPYVGVYLDVGNMVQFSWPEHWIRALGSRIKMVHFKDFRRSVGNMDGFVDLLEGDVDFEAVVREFDKIGYHGWAFAEMWPPYRTHPELTIQFTSAAMDKILGK